MHHTRKSDTRIFYVNFFSYCMYKIVSLLWLLSVMNLP
jgi:hypothetical protein